MKIFAKPTSRVIFCFILMSSHQVHAEDADVVVEAEQLATKLTADEVARVLSDGSPYRYRVFALTSPGVELSHARSPSHPVRLAIRRRADGLGRPISEMEKKELEEFSRSSYQRYLEQVKDLQEGGDLYAFEREHPQKAPEGQAGVMIVRKGKIIKMWFTGK